MPKRITCEDFIKRAKVIHGDEYDYSETCYENMHSSVRIVCSVHGVFEQNPQAHLRGQGCPVCGKEKCRLTMMKKYGTDNPMKVPEFYKKARNTCRKTYGSDWAMSAEETKAKMRTTNQERYGVDAPIQNPEIYGKMMATNLSKYGVVYSSQNEYIKKKIFDTKRKSNSFGDSKSEEILYEMLCSEFGANDVERQYWSACYPYSCDFYIKSRGLYIELNGTWTHGGHWYEGTVEDELRIETYRSRGTKYYENVIDNWTGLDVRKRECARKNGLNYVVFWDSSLRDAELWFSMGCPDGHDWDKMYSWISDSSGES